MKILKKTYNPCDDCQYSYSKQNQESNTCRICEFKKILDAEEQGLLLRLPCKVGDVLWWTDAFGDLCSSEVNSMFIEQGIDGIVIETWICNINGKEIGKTAFLTQEEAEQALARLREE